MKSKNTFIAIGVLVIGFILYKVLLGFVLPIALFVSLGYVLKFLLKGSESDPVKEVSQILTNNDPSSSVENIVEIKPIEEEKSSEDVKPIEEEKSSEDVKPIEDEKSTEEIKPIEDEKSAENKKTIEEDKPY